MGSAWTEAMTSVEVINEKTRRYRKEYEKLYAEMKFLEFHLQWLGVTSDTFNQKLDSYRSTFEEFGDVMLKFADVMRSRLDTAPVAIPLHLLHFERLEVIEKKTLGYRTEYDALYVEVENFESPEWWGIASDTFNQKLNSYRSTFEELEKVMLNFVDSIRMLL